MGISSWGQDDKEEAKMGRLIEQGSFQTHADVPLNAVEPIINEYSLYSRKTTVVIAG